LISFSHPSSKLMQLLPVPVEVDIFSNRYERNDVEKGSATA